MAAAGESVQSHCTEAIISGIPDEVTEDHLINFLECKAPECHVDTVHFKKGDTALITFKTSVDMGVLQVICEQFPQEGRVLKVLPVDKRGAVLIHNPYPQTSTNSFKYYLSNKKRSGGSNIAEIRRDECNSFLIAYFHSREDAEEVAKRKHKLEQQELQVELFDPNFGELPDSNEDHRLKPPVEPESFNTVQPDAHFTQSMETTESSYNSVVSGMPAESSYNSMVSGMPAESSYNSVVSGMPAESNYDSIVSDRQTVRNRSEETTENVQDAAVPEKKPEPSIRTVAGLCPTYQKLLDVVSGSIPAQLLDVQMQIEDGCVEIRGECHEVEKAETLVVRLYEKQNPSKYVNGLAASFSGWEEVFEDIEESVGREECMLLIQEGSFGTEEFCIHLKQSDRSLSFDDFLNTQVAQKTVLVKSKEAEELLATTSWQEFCENDLEDRFGSQVMAVYNDKDHTVEIFGKGTFLEEAVKLVEVFLLNIYDDQQFHLSDTEKHFVQKFRLKGHTYLQKGTGADFVELTLDESCYTIKGNRAGVRHEARQFELFHKNFKCKRAILSHPKLSTLQGENGGFWMERVRNIGTENGCHITDLPDPQIHDADEDGETWGRWMAAVIHSFFLPDHSLELHVVEGRAEELKVDAVVLCCGDTPQHPPSLPAQGARPKTYPHGPEHRGLVQQGEGIRVTQPGARPCRAVLQVSLQHYFPALPGRSWDNSVQNLLTDLFTLCDDHHFASVALPVFGVDEGDGSKPIDEATGILARRIVDVLHSRERREGRRVRHVCLCSPRPACVHGLTYILQYDLSWIISPPSPHSFNFLPTDMPKPRTRPVSIDVNRSDIARAQVEALVVPCDIDNDLDLYKSQVTKSLVRGGSYVQTSLQHGDSMIRTETRESRNEQLAEHRVVSGRGGGLSANHIFYVFLPPWGPCATQELRGCIEKSLKEASSKKCRSVALTALGVGKLEYPLRYAARTALCAVADFMQTEPSLRNVQFVVYDQATHEVYQEELWGLQREHALSDVGSSVPPLLEYPHHTERSSYAHVANKSSASGSYPYISHPYRGSGRSQSHHHGAQTTKPSCPGAYRDYIMIKGVKLRIKIGNITREKCDAVVNSTNPGFEFTGGVARAFEKHCGDFLIRLCRTDKNLKEMKKMGVVVTEAPGLQCLAMVHLDLLKFKEKPKEALLKCLTTLLKARPKCTSVAFPALGAGAAKFNSPEHVVNNLKDALGELKKPRELKEVVVVVGSQDMYQRMAVCLGHHQATPTPAPAPYSKPRSAPTGMGGAAAAAATSTEVPPSNSSSVLVTKMPRSKWADTNTLSLFIFSDDEEKREKVCRKLAEEVESTLGVAARRRQGEDDPQVGCLPKLAGYIGMI